MFGLGTDDRHVSPIDASGVVLSALQGLHALVNAQAARMVTLEGECAGLRAELERLRAELGAGEPPA